MAAGTVVISDAGAETSKTGAAGRLYDLLKAATDAKLAELGEDPLTGEEAAPAMQGIAATANAMASWLVNELTVKTVATITTSQAGLQRMPASTAENTETKAPAALKSLVLAHTT